jgi:hypothetical protein
LALIWLVLLGEPAIQPKLPLVVQQDLNSEVGTVGLALALTAIIMSRKDKVSGKKD